MELYSDISSLQDTTRNFAVLYKELEAEHDKSKSASKSLEERTKKLESELRDARDNSELLEFRLLELEQRESRERSPDMVRKLETAETVTESQDDRMSSGAPDSGCSGSLASLDDLIETQTDFRVSHKLKGTFPRFYHHHQNVGILKPNGSFSSIVNLQAIIRTIGGLLCDINSDSYLG